MGRAGGSLECSASEGPAMRRESDGIRHRRLELASGRGAAFLNKPDTFREAASLTWLKRFDAPNPA